MARRRPAAALAALVLLAAAPGGAGAREAGVSADRVLFGQSAAFTGPAGELGEDMRLGIRAAFREANDRGGVHGRALELVSLDDAYEPEAAVRNTRRLIEEEGVFALIGAVGTPTSRSAVPVAGAAGVPYVAPFTGAAFLRDTELRHVVNLRASYYQETEEIVSRLVDDLGAERVAVFYQDDSFGRAGFSGVRRALEWRGLEPVATGVYPRNTTAVKTALLDLLAGEPEGVVLVGAYRPVARLIAWSRHIGFEPLFMTISFVGGNALVRELGPDGPGVFVTQVVSSPLADDPAAAVAYRRALEAAAPGTAPGFVSFEGYLAGRLAIHALEQCGAAPDRACFLAAVREAEAIDLDGFELSYGAGGNQGSDAVFLTVIDSGGGYSAVRSLSDAARP